MPKASGEAILKSIAENRQALAKQIRELRRIQASDEQLRKRRIREAWVEAMREHYKLVDRYLMLRAWASRIENVMPVPAQGDVQANELWAPPRPVEVPDSIRPNLVAEIRPGGSNGIRLSRAEWSETEPGRGACPERE